MRRWLLALVLMAVPAQAQTVLSVEHFTVTIADAGSSATATPTLGQDMSMSVPFVTFRHGAVDGSSGDFEDFHCSVTISGGNVVVQRSSTGGNNGSIVAEIYLVEFDPTHWTVQSGSFVHDTTPQEGMSQTVTNTDRAFAVFYSRATSGNGDSYYAHGATLNSFTTTAISWYRPIAGPPSLTVNWWTVEDISSTQQISVQRVQADTNDTVYQAITTITTVDPDRTWLLASTARGTSSTAQSANLSGVVAQLLSPTTLRCHRSNIATPAGNNYCWLQVIEFVGDWGTVQRGRIELWGSPGETSRSGPIITPGTDLAIPVIPSMQNSLITATGDDGNTLRQAISLVAVKLGTTGTFANDRITVEREFNTVVPPATSLLAHTEWQLVDWGADPEDPVPGNTAFNLAWRESWVSPISPAFDAGWEQTGEAKRGYLAEDLTGLVGYFGINLASKLTHRVTLTVNSADQELLMQFISRPLAAGSVFTSGVTTVNFSTRMAEQNALDNINQCITGLRVIDDDGSTVKATLLGVANYGNSSEFPVVDYQFSQQNLASKLCVDGDTVTSSYTIEDGDYLVAEVGFQSTGATDADPQAYAAPFDGGGIADTYSITNNEWSWPCTTNELTPADFCYAQLIIGTTLITQTDDPNPGPTRLYLPATEAAAVSPATSSVVHDGHAATSYTFWEYSDELLRRRMVKFKGSSTTAIGQTVDTVSTSSGLSEIDRQYVSDPMVAGITFTKFKTHITAQVRGVEVNAADSVVPIGGVRIYSNDGTTLRATLLPVDFYWGQESIAVGCASGCYAELGTTFALNETIFKRALVQETYTTVAGDRLVYELGGWRYDLAEASQFSFYYGETDADCDETDSSSVTACSPWLEFSNNIVFTTDPATALPRLPFFGRFL